MRSRMLVLLALCCAGPAAADKAKVTRGPNLHSTSAQVEMTVQSGTNVKSVALLNHERGRVQVRSLFHLFELDGPVEYKGKSVHVQKFVMHSAIDDATTVRTKLPSVRTFPDMFSIRNAEFADELQVASPSLEGGQRYVQLIVAPEKLARVLRKSPGFASLEERGYDLTKAQVTAVGDADRHPLLEIVVPAPE